MPSTTAQLEERYRVQISAQFAKTKSQVSRETKEGREILLRHIAKLGRRVRGRGNLCCAPKLIKPIKERNNGLRNIKRCRGRIHSICCTGAGAELLAALRSPQHVEIEGWSLNLDEHGVWLTNPYGIDCGLVPATADGCQTALARIKGDTHEREWA